MRHSNKDMYYYSLYLRRDDNLSVAGDGRGDVGTRTTHFYPQKVDFSTDRHDEGFRKSLSHRTETPMRS